MIHSLVEFLINFISQIGYFGIFIGMFLESTLVPLPSELIMIPAGMAAQQGLMNIYLVIFVGVLGNILGAVFSSYLAVFVGRKVLLRIGKYFFIKAETIIHIENFFKNHGPISIFLGRLLPGFRHFISLPAGIAKMDMRLFLIYTTAGSTIWDIVLTALGFFIGQNQELIEKNLHGIIAAVVLICVVILVGYVFYKKRITRHR